MIVSKDKNDNAADDVISDDGGCVNMNVQLLVI